MHYLYRITNQVNGKVYIGQTENLRKRWYDHRKGTGKPTQAIHHAMIKYGIDNFIFDHIATCKTLEDANETETILVKQYESHVSLGKGYNVTWGGMNAPKTDEWKQHMSEVMSGRVMSEEQKQKLREANLGKRQSEETIQKRVAKITGSGNGFFGKTHTNESREKMSKSLKGRASPNKGKKASEELCKKLSESHKGQVPWIIGKKHSDEAKQKMSAAKLGKKRGPMSEETKRKISEIKRSKHKVS